jgi:hypothetical protein
LIILLMSCWISLPKVESNPPSPSDVSKRLPWPSWEILSLVLVSTKSLYNSVRHELTVNNSVSCRNDRVLPASKQSIERMKAVMAQASVKRDDNRILYESRLCAGI